MPINNPQTPEEYAAYLEEWNKILEEFNQMLSAQNARKQQTQQGDQGGGMEMGLSLESLMGGGEGASMAPSIGGGTAALGTGPSSGAGAAGGGGGGSAAGSSAGGIGAGGAYAAIAALIAAGIHAQHKATEHNKRKIEGQEAGDWFSHGNIGDKGFATEPWFAMLSDKLGLNATAGEKFDAAYRNKDWGTALKRLPAAADYWVDPARSWIGKGGEYAGTKLTGSKKGGKVGSAILNPIGALLSLFGK